VDSAVDPATGRRSIANRVVIKMPGFAGMPTYRVLIRYVGRFESPLAGGSHTLTYEDRSYFSSPGLKRVLVERSPDMDYLAPQPDFWSGDPFKFEQYDPANLPQIRSAQVRFKLAAPATATAPVEPAAQVVSSRPEARGLAGVPDRYVQGLTAPVAGVQTQYQAQANRLMDLLKGRWGVVMFLMVTGMAFTWGAVHALMPGHAKTVVAAYLISQSGTYWHAVLLAIVVTITHTALVVVLGAVWAFYQATNPALGPRLQLWLGLISGVLVAVMGLTLIWRAWRGGLGHHHHEHHGHEHERQSWLRRLFSHSHAPVPGHSHDHDHSHNHEHPHEHEHDQGHEHGHDHSHEHAHDHHHHDHAHPHEHAHDHPHDHGHDHAAGHAPARSADTPSAAQVSGRMILMLGITGGIVPCPTATIIMLLGIGANVVVGALYAVAVFSLGLALTLMLIGFLALSSRRFATRLMSGEDDRGELSGTGRFILLRLLPALSGLVVVLLGAAIAANYIQYMRTGAALFKWMG
jgi:nickel/cobalt transporter (NicO) family protein